MGGGGVAKVIPEDAPSTRYAHPIKQRTEVEIVALIVVICVANNGEWIILGRYQLKQETRVARRNFHVTIAYAPQGCLV